MKDRNCFEERELSRAKETETYVLAEGDTDKNELMCPMMAQELEAVGSGESRDEA